MDTVPCGQCHGSGKQRSIVYLDTGETEYRTCTVCGGTGSVSVDREYYTRYPDVSLRNALSLIERLGKPVEVAVAENDDVQVVFPGGTRVVLGGFAVGYRGTGPDFFKRLLDVAGFDISIDEIAAMKAPVVIGAGQRPATSEPAD